MDRLTDAQRDLAGSPESLAIANTAARVFSKRCPRHRDELLSVARLALCEAAASWQPDRSEWKTWALVIIRGRLLDSVRASLSAGMRIGRRARACGYAPGIVLGSERLGGREGEPETVADQIPADELPVGWELESEDTVRAYSKRLDRKSAVMFRLYLLRADFHGRLKDVAAHLGYSESRVSQLLNGAMGALRPEGSAAQPLSLCARPRHGEGTSRGAMRRKLRSAAN
ncbi:MAG TPA: sigma factor [Gemmata sp.]